MNVILVLLTAPLAAASLAFVRSTESRPISFFFNDTATTEIYTLSLHDALPISVRNGHGGAADDAHRGTERLPERVRHGPVEDGRALRRGGDAGHERQEGEQRCAHHGGHGGK